MTPRLLSAIFFAIDYEALQNASTRRIPLADLVSDDQELIGDLLAEATYETAHDLAQTLMLNQGFEDLSKKSLLARFIRLFPSIQAIVGGEASSGGSSEEEELVVSKSSFESRKKEYEELIQVKIPRNKEEIAEARGHGDLRENAEYKMARQEQDILLAHKNERRSSVSAAWSNWSAPRKMRKSPTLSSAHGTGIRTRASFPTRPPWPRLSLASPGATRWLSKLMTTRKPTSFATSSAGWIRIDG